MTVPQQGRSCLWVEFNGDTWLHFPNIVADVAIIRATTADESGNLTYEHEGPIWEAL
ncbi:MAG: CoA-transferase [Geminicoccaceae bacterium]